MGTTIRPELSKNNKYYVSKHRYYELKHHCLQYPTWKKAYDSLGLSIINSNHNVLVTNKDKTHVTDPTSRIALQMLYYSNRMQLIDRVANDTDPELAHYIVRAVTENLSYTYLSQTLNIPCSRDTYYDRYRRFFWLLNRAKD